MIEVVASSPGLPGFHCIYGRHTLCQRLHFLLQDSYSIGHKFLQTFLKWTLFQWGSKVSTNWSNTWKHACYCAFMYTLHGNIHVFL